MVLNNYAIGIRIDFDEHQMHHDHKNFFYGKFGSSNVFNYKKKSFNYEALSFVFLIRPIPAKKKMAPTIPVKIMLFILVALLPPLIK